VARSIIGKDYPVSDWNVYCFQFSDGDNWGEDNNACIEMLVNDILPACNLFCYGQVESRYGSAEYLHELQRIAPAWDRLLLSEIENKEAIYESIRTFLGKGK